MSAQEGGVLLPCPFCGGKAHIERQSDADDFGIFYSVACDGCNARTGSQYASHGNDCPQMYAEVRDRWNVRPAIDALIEADKRYDDSRYGLARARYNGSPVEPWVQGCADAEIGRASALAALEPQS